MSVTHQEKKKKETHTAEISTSDHKLLAFAVELKSPLN